LTGQNISARLFGEQFVAEGTESTEPFNILWFHKIIDINGDGRDDLGFSATQNTLFSEVPFLIWTATESGTLQDSTDTLIQGTKPVSGWGYRSFLPGDYNGDGRLDLFLESQGIEEDAVEECGPTPNCWPGGENVLLLSTPDDRLLNVSSTHLPDFIDFSHGSTSGDFDGDGDLDIWVQNFGGSGLYNPWWSYMMYNDGTGKFEVVAELSDELGSPPDYKYNGIIPSGYIYGSGSWSNAIDADGDGDIDLNLNRDYRVELIPDESEPSGYAYGPSLFYNRLWLNDGSGSFSIQPDEPYPSPGCSVSPEFYDPDLCATDRAPVTNETHTWDLNLDGLQDMFLTQIIDVDDDDYEYMQILVSNGDGTFRDETAERFDKSPEVNVWSFHLHDFDNDGQPDILFHDIEGDSDFIYMNDGEGYFRMLASDWINIGKLWAVLDIDGDGGSDFVEPNSSGGLYVTKMIQPYGAEFDGTASNDRLIGGSHDNVFQGLEGSDVLDGGLGDDSLAGGEGNDELIGRKGDDTYVFHSADLGDNDTISDKAGIDLLKFDGFDLASVSQARQDESGNLVLDFISGGSLKAFFHFSQPGSSIEFIEVAECKYQLSNDPSFESGPIQNILGGCILFDDGFE
jgi:hypothetical protein